MAIPIIFNWPAPNTTGITSSQNPLGLVFVLDGPLVLQYHEGADRVASFGNTSRTVSVTSSVNNSGISYIITGTYRNNFHTETIVGPNNTTVYTTTLFDTVTSIVMSGPPLGASSIGSGTTGQTQWFNHNYHSTVIGFSIQATITGAINYSYQVTLDDIQTIAVPTVFTPIVALTGATTNELGSILFPLRYSNIIINSSTNGSLVGTFIQQGIT